MGLGEGERPRIGEFGVVGKLLGELFVERADPLVERREILAKLRLHLDIARIGRLAHRLHQPCIEAPPLLNGVLVRPGEHRQRVIAGCEARAHAGDRASRA